MYIQRRATKPVTVTVMRTLKDSSQGYQTTTPPRRPCQAQISPCLHTGSLHCNCHSSLVRYTIHPILQMRRPELREVSQLAGRHTAGEQLSQESNPGVSESWRLTIPHHRHLPTLRLP